MIKLALLIGGTIAASVYMMCGWWTWPFCGF